MYADVRTSDDGISFHRPSATSDVSGYEYSSTLTLAKDTPDIGPTSKPGDPAYANMQQQSAAYVDTATPSKPDLGDGYAHMAHGAAAAAVGAAGAFIDPDAEQPYEYENPADFQKETLAQFASASASAKDVAFNSDGSLTLGLKTATSQVKVCAGGSRDKKTEKAVGTRSACAISQTDYADEGAPLLPSP